VKLRALLLGVLVKPSEPVGEPVKPGNTPGGPANLGEPAEKAKPEKIPGGPVNPGAPAVIRRSFVGLGLSIRALSLSGIRVLDRRVIGH
jgi:hypothetical protein